MIPSNFTRFPDHSRVWIYQAGRELNPQELTTVEKALQEFTGSWSAHGKPLSAAGLIRYNRFIILMVDEDHEAPSGCSIDKSASLIRELGTKLGVDFFDRWNIAYRKGDHILSCSREEFEAKIRQGEITSGTIVFNNLAATKAELEQNWEVSMKDSWHARIFGTEPLS